MKDYIIDIRGNEELIEQFINAIENENCKIAEEYPNPYMLSSGEKVLNSTVLKYFFQTRSFSKERYISFCEKLRRLEKRGFNDYSYSLGHCITDLVCNHLPQAKKNKQGLVTTPSDEKSELTSLQREILSFVCYVAVCHIKYGASYETVVAEDYFKVVTDLGSDEVSRLKKYGTGNLSKQLTEYKDAYVSCKANDAFATIKIKAIQESEETYAKALDFICNLLKTDFPKSYALEFSTKLKNTLPIKGLIKNGIHYFFANAVQYSSLHPQIEVYARLAMRKWEWYNNMHDEDCAMPSTFAVFALGLQNEQYFDLVIRYMEQVDDEHQSIHAKFTPVFLEKYGIHSNTLPVYIKCVMSMQEHPYNKVFQSYFNTAGTLTLLLESKDNLKSYFTADELEDMEESGNSIDEMAEWVWDHILYTTFGDQKKQNKILKEAPEELKEIYQKLFQGK
ncbi:MAG: DUF6138 family protein [Tannerella sp.]|jgi:hypothetical protein|nr:DUF6138 family protein [Tannerella sp.]